MSDLMSWIWLSSLHRLKGERRRALLEILKTPAEVFAASPEALRGAGLSEEECKEILRHDLEKSERIAADCERENIKIMTIQDADYPVCLRNISDPPLVLYIKGKLPDVDAEPSFAVVGTRKCTPYGEKVSRNLGYGIAEGGGVVVTGLAAGCDSMAAKGALMAGGRVVGVLGTAIDEVFPQFNRQLFDDVEASGALVSEYPPGEGMNSRHFPARNRIMAGLTLCTVVTEAPLRSGALITARLALEYGRDVFAVPGNVDASASAGSNALLREGARLCTTAWDVLGEYESSYPEKIREMRRLKVPAERHIPKFEAENGADREKKAPKKRLFARKPKKMREEAPDSAVMPPVPLAERPKTLPEQLEKLSETQLKIVSVMTKPEMHIDDIIDLSALPASTVLAEMTLLQIKGVVEQKPGKRFTLKIAKRG